MNRFNRTKIGMAFSIYTFLIFIIFLGFQGCAEKQEEILIDGSSTVYPLTQAVAEEFSKQFDYKVTVSVSGTGGGFKRFTRGETDISNASRPIKPSEDEHCKKNQIEYIEIPVAIDGLSVVVHPDNDWVDYLRVSELKKIWEPEAEGKITRWNQIRKEWPDAELHLFGAGVASGTFDYFTEVICGKEDASRGDYTSSEDDNVLVHGVANDKYALGYFGLAYYEANKDRLKVVPIDDENPTNGDGPIAPTWENIEEGIYQPLARPIFIYVNRKRLEKKPQLKKFVEFYIKNAGRLAKEVRYIPLSKEAYDLNLECFEKGKTGSVFTTASPQTKIVDLLKQKCEKKN